jgi:hypothetical protein
MDNSNNREMIEYELDEGICKNKNGKMNSMEEEEEEKKISCDMKK